MNLARIRYSKLAIVSLVLASVGALFALSRDGRLLVLAIPLGLMALCIAGLAGWLIRRAAGAMRGRRLAILGATLGAFATVLSLLGLGALIRKEFNRVQRQQQAWNPPMQPVEIPAPNPVPRVPATNFTSNLPIIVLQTSGQPISRHAQTLVRAKFFDAG
ncbi:MAG: hypothetical protein HYY23_01760, partial [Verrucomicrobia bacterium]|nr:hypothetical protein [Verrucomicrobiota bacterium]